MPKNEKATAEFKRSWERVNDRFNELSAQYASIPYDKMLGAFAKAGLDMANEPHIQNNRIKAISSLPADFTKDEIGEFLRRPYESEQPLRETAETLAWTAYPFYKIVKTYADIPTYHYYTKPLYLEGEEAKEKDFLREATLLDKISKELDPKKVCHSIVGKALKQGKVFYTIRYDIDKSHNAVNSVFLQQLPEDYCMLIGHNNISGWTVSFNMMYFMQPGTSVWAYGDLFEPYLEDFNGMFGIGEQKDKRFVYGAKECVDEIECKGKKIEFYPDRVKSNATGSPRVFMQNGEWMYWVSLPIDRVWVYEIDDTTPAVASPLAGLFLTYAQEADYEATQLSLLMNPLIKIFTAETPYFTDNGSTTEDGFRMSLNVRKLFEVWFDELMSEHNTGGTALFSMPATDIKSHDFAESANANDISSSFNRYAGTKAGLAALIPVDDDIKAAQTEVSRLIESRYATATIYPQFCRMMNILYANLKLKYEWEFVMFGTIFTDAEDRKNAETMVARGDMTGYMIEGAIDGFSWIDKISSLKMLDASGITELFKVPQTAYTQSAKGGSVTEKSSVTVKSPGRPKEEVTEMSESKEKAVDAGNLEG